MNIEALRSRLAQDARPHHSYNEKRRANLPGADLEPGQGAAFV